MQPHPPRKVRVNACVKVKSVYGLRTGEEEWENPILRVQVRKLMIVDLN